MEFYNDKDVITQIEWLKNNIQADHIDSIQVVQNVDKTADDYGLTTVKITMENGHEYKGEVISAILKDVRIQSGEDFSVMVFELANGETLSCNIPLGSDSYWAKIKGEPQSNAALKAWMDEKAEAVDLTNETQIRVRSDEALGQRITDHERVVNEQIERIDGILIDKADRSALDEEIYKRTEADTGLLQAITEEETARKSADDGIYGRITELNKDLDDETTARTNADNSLSQKITNLDNDVSGEIERIDGEIAQEITDRQQAENLKEDKANKVTSWSATPDDTRYPSEKLVKDTMKYLYKTDSYAKLDVSKNTGGGHNYVDGAFWGGENNTLCRVMIINFDKYLDNLQKNTIELFGIALTKPLNLDFISIQTSFNGVRYKLEWLSEPEHSSYRLMATRLDGQNWGTDRVAGYGLLLSDGADS